MPSKASSHTDRFKVTALVVTLFFAWSIYDRYKRGSRDRDCKRSLDVIEEAIRHDPDALTEEEKAYVRYHAETAVDTFPPQKMISTKRIISMDEYLERIAAQKRIHAIRDRIDRQSGQ